MDIEMHRCLDAYAMLGAVAQLLVEAGMHNINVEFASTTARTDPRCRQVGRVSLQMSREHSVGPRLN